MKGIITIAFGTEYDRIAAHTMKISRRNTLLPICVFTNLPYEQRHPLWQDIASVTFEYFPEARDADNRWAKFRMFDRSPFDNTLYIDADAVIQNKHVDCIFDMLSHADFVLNGPYIWKRGDKVPNIYAAAMLKCGSKLPMTAYNGGFLAWRRDEVAGEVFDFWEEYWKLTGEGRDMPALACAVQRVKPLMFDVALSPVFAAAEKKPQHIIQHNYNGTFFEDFNLPRYQENKSFDKVEDFKFTDFKRVVTIKSFNGIGDLLFVTPALEVIKKAYSDCKLVVNTNRPGLLVNNPYVDTVNAGTDGVFLGYNAPDTGKLPDKHHILTDWEIVCKEYNLYTEPPTLRPQLYFKDLPDKRDLIGVQVLHKRNYHSKRVWPGFDELAERPGFMPIPHVSDDSKLVRQISSYKAVVCAEGGISHIAAALNMPAVVIFGGFSDPEWTGYPDHVNITSNIECRHCFNNLPCVNEEPFKCFKNISVDCVEETARKLIGQDVSKSQA